MLEWDDVVATGDPHAAGLAFARSAFRHACLVCDWDPGLPASAEGDPPPSSEVYGRVRNWPRNERATAVSTR